MGCEFPIHDCPALAGSQLRLLREIVTGRYNLDCVFRKKILDGPVSAVLKSPPPIFCIPFFSIFLRVQSCVVVNR